MYPLRGFPSITEGLLGPAVGRSISNFQQYLSDREIERADKQSSDRATERPSDRAIERSSDRTSDRAIERPSDRATERSSDSEQVITWAPDGLFRR